MAGHMGIKSDLVDADYPRFLVCNKTWEKTKEDFYDAKGDKPKISSMKDSPEQEMMMVTFKYNKSNSRKSVETRRHKPERC